MLTFLLLDKLLCPASCMMLNPMAAKFIPNKMHNNTDIGQNGVAKTKMLYKIMAELISTIVFWYIFEPPVVRLAVLAKYSLTLLFKILEKEVSLLLNFVDFFMWYFAKFRGTDHDDARWKA